MAHIPNNELERLKAEVSLQRLVESAGVVLKRQGKDYVGRCPFHDDKTPSLIISPDKNLWHCLGACGEGGDVIQWTMKQQGVSFRHAVDLLRGESCTPLAANPELDVTNPLDTGMEDQALLNQVIDYYHQTLKQSPEALDYLHKRGLDHPELIERFKLGYANRSLAYRLPNKGTKAYQAIRGQLQRTGILRDSGHEHLNGSLVIPVFDGQGNVVEAYGRKIGERLRKGTPLHLYLPGQHAGVFNPEALVSSAEIILCESLIDALTFWKAGYRNVTTSYGVNGFTEELLQALIEHRVERILIAYDRDEAGNQAAEALAKRLNAQGIDAFRIGFPKGMDANEYALQVQPAVKSLGLVIRKAEFMSAGKAPAISTVTAITTSPETAELSDPMVEPQAQTEAPEDIPIPASPLPESKNPTVEADIQDHEVNVQLESRHYRIRGLNKNQSYEQLKINLLVRVDDTAYVDTLDLYNARQRQGFIKPASIELGLHEDTLKTDLSQLLLKLEQLQDEQIRHMCAPPNRLPKIIW